MLKLILQLRNLLLRVPDELDCIIFIIVTSSFAIRRWIVWHRQVFGRLRVFIHSSDAPLLTLVLLLRLTFTNRFLHWQIHLRIDVRGRWGDHSALIGDLVVYDSCFVCLLGGLGQHHPRLHVRQRRQPVEKWRWHLLLLYYLVSAISNLERFGPWDGGLVRYGIVSTT